MWDSAWKAESTLSFRLLSQQKVVEILMCSLRNQIKTLQTKKIGEAKGSYEGESTDSYYRQIAKYTVCAP